MEAELDAAAEDGRALGFALGCVAAAWRELPAHEEGRFILASNALALVLLVPAAALLLASVAGDFPFSYLGAAGGQMPLVNDANLPAVPPLAALVALLAAAHLRIAWLVLERDWDRVAGAAMLAAAAAVTSVIFTAVAFVDCASAIRQAGTLCVELAAVAALARWHGRRAYA